MLFKFHPNEVMDRAVAEVKQYAPPGTMIFTEGNTEEMIANSVELITQYSTVAYVALALGIPVHSYFRCGRPQAQTAHPERGYQRPAHRRRLPTVWWFQWLGAGVSAAVPAHTYCCADRRDNRNGLLSRYRNSWAVLVTVCAKNITFCAKAIWADFRQTLPLAALR